MYTFDQVYRLVLREARYQQEKAEETNTILHVPCILGPVGIGKTRLIRKLSEELDMSVCRINCGDTVDATDVSGMLIPAMTEIREDIPVLRWGLNEVLAEACLNPRILFFDDIDKMQDSVQGALLSITGERTSRQYIIHPQTVIVAAGNRPEDDVLARELSESLRTRLTVLEMHAHLESWCRWGLETKTIPEEIVGYLNWQPAAFSGKTKDTARFPTPRGWEEAAQDMKRYPDPFEDVLGNKSRDNWRVIVSMRCGESTSKTFWAWYLLVRDIDVEQILDTGKVEAKSASPDTDPAMLTYAAIYGVATRLGRGGFSKKKHPGIEIFIKTLNNESRIALLIQLPPQAQATLKKEFPAAHATIVGSITGTL